MERCVGAVATLWLIEADVPRFVPEVAGASELEPSRAEAVHPRAQAIDPVNDDDVIEQRGSPVEPIARWWLCCDAERPIDCDARKRLETHLPRRATPEDHVLERALVVRRCRDLD